MAGNLYRILVIRLYFRGLMSCHIRPSQSIHWQSCLETLIVPYCKPCVVHRLQIHLASQHRCDLDCIWGRWHLGLWAMWILDSACSEIPWTLPPAWNPQRHLAGFKLAKLLQRLFLRPHGLSSTHAHLCRREDSSLHKHTSDYHFSTSRLSSIIFVINLSKALSTRKQAHDTSIYANRVAYSNAVRSYLQETCDVSAAARFIGQNIRQITPNNFSRRVNIQRCFCLPENTDQSS